MQQLTTQQQTPKHKFSTTPLYIQVKDAVAERISAGEWKPGTALPNETDFAREYGVASGTMRVALNLLEREGILTRTQGKGTFVNDVYATTEARMHGCRAKADEILQGAPSKTALKERIARALFLASHRS